MMLALNPISVQADLFTNMGECEISSNLPAPRLIPHVQPFPGMSPEDSARSALSMSEAYSEVVLATILNKGGRLTTSQVMSILPHDWTELLGPWVHADLPPRIADLHGITKDYVAHDGGGFHFEYRVHQ